MALVFSLGAMVGECSGINRQGSREELDPPGQAMTTTENARQFLSGLGQWVHFPKTEGSPVDIVSKGLFKGF